MGALATALVAGVGGWLVLGDELTAGVVIVFVLYVDRFFEPIRELAQRYNVFQATMAASERVFNLLDIEPTIIEPPRAEDLPLIAGEVEFRDVRFGYGDDEVVAASQAVGAHDFISKMTDGYETEVGENGVSVAHKI